MTEPLLRDIDIPEVGAPVGLRDLADGIDKPEETATRYVVTRSWRTASNGRRD